MNDCPIWLLALMMLASAFLGMAVVGSCYQKEAIAKGYAEYNRKTGDWQWIDSAKNKQGEPSEKLK